MGWWLDVKAVLINCLQQSKTFDASYIKDGLAQWSTYLSF
jgi:hypothetical protein